jgi:hypothetical protein
LLPVGWLLPHAHWDYSYALALNYGCYDQRAVLWQRYYSGALFDYYFDGWLPFPVRHFRLLRLQLAQVALLPLCGWYSFVL